MTTEDHLFLKKLPLADLLGLSKVPADKSTVVTAVFWEKLLANFLKNILPKTITEEELKTLAEIGQNGAGFDAFFSQLVDKYPNLQKEFEESFVQYKSLVLTERLDFMRRENLLDAEEYVVAKELASKEAWQNLYADVISPKDSAGIVCTVS